MAHLFIMLSLFILQLQLTVSHIVCEDSKFNYLVRYSPQLTTSSVLTMQYSLSNQNLC